MLVKWITCRVVDRPGFDRGQHAWGSLRDVPGFLGQGGGWGAGDQAHVFGFWADQANYRSFMDGPHNGMAATQVGTYLSIQVRLLEHRLDIGRPISPGFSRASMLRLAHCHVHNGRSAHFRVAQEMVWNPGMAAAPGMLGGVFAQACETEFLVLSQWASVADHETYRTDRFPDLHRRAAAAEDVAKITGDLITVDPGWSVVAVPSE